MANGQSVTAPPRFCVLMGRPRAVGQANRLAKAGRAMFACVFGRVPSSRSSAALMNHVRLKEGKKTSQRACQNEILGGLGCDPGHSLQLTRGQGWLARVDVGGRAGDVGRQCPPCGAHFVPGPVTQSDTARSDLYLSASLSPSPSLLARLVLFLLPYSRFCVTRLISSSFHQRYRFSHLHL